MYDNLKKKKKKRSHYMLYTHTKFYYLKKCYIIYKKLISKQMSALNSFLYLELIDFLLKY